MEVKSHSKSKVPSIKALEPHTATFETFMSTAHDTLESLEEMVDGLVGEYVKFTVDIEDLF